MKSITTPLSAYKQAHQLLWKRNFWKYLIWPVLISFVITLLLLAGYVAVGDYLVSNVEEYFFGEEKIPAWLKAIFWLGVLFLFSGPLYVGFRGLVMICYGPFLDNLSQEIEREVNAEVRNAERSFIESIKRPTIMFVWTFAASIGVLLGGIAVGAIPLAGVILAALLPFPFQMFLSGVAYIDPYLDRANYSPKESFAAIRKHFGGVALFAMIGLVIQAIPIIGWFIGPTYSVIAGVLYGIRVEKDCPLPTKPAPGLASDQHEEAGAG
ncbi:EI24 domain-containing protein [Cerasicoccus maritimus]|uniref:EI24 domain-containing protein n=1 Tax=Cerasicoccus maritimus TaxID=490089 RepID=UPI0028527BFD|nr:EI24 domain-containing protein [Cerasicoccus maritimus]